MRSNVSIQQYTPVLRGGKRHKWPASLSRHKDEAEQRSTWVLLIPSTSPCHQGHHRHSVFGATDEHPVSVNRENRNHLSNYYSTGQIKSSAENSGSERQLCLGLSVFPRTLLHIYSSLEHHRCSHCRSLLHSLCFVRGTTAGFSVSSPSFTGHRRLGTTSMLTTTSSSDRKDAAMKLIRISPKTVTVRV